jgi:hypothetical protein
MATNKNLTNSELSEKFAEQIESNQVFIVDAQDTSNDEFRMLYLAQKSNIGNADEANALFLGWTGQIVRSLRNLAKAQIANVQKALKVKLEVGDVLPQEWNIQVTDTVSPESLATWVNGDGEMMEEQPRKFGASHPTFPGEVCVDINNQPIYRRTSLVKGTPNNIVINAANSELTQSTSSTDADNALAGDSVQEKS